jgi:site-specific DNA-cytosine methylase
VLTDSTSTLEWRNQNEGKDDPRHLWPDVFRVLQEISPKLCFFENVPGHLRLGFEQVHDDLSSLGYCVKAGLFSAAEVGASHKREPLFILAYRESDRVDRWLSDLQEIQRMVGCEEILFVLSATIMFANICYSKLNDKAKLDF